MENYRTIKGITMRNILLIILLSFSLTSIGQPLMGIISSSQNNVSLSIPANNNILAETFEGTGYSVAGWTETIGTNAGCLVDEDNTDATPVQGTQALKVVSINTPTAAQANAYANRSITSSPILYFDAYIQIASHGLTTNAQQIILVKAMNASYQPVFTINLYYSTRAYVQVGYYNNGTTSFLASGDLTLNHWYHIQIKYDSTNLAYSVIVDGTILSSGSLTGTLRGNVTMMRIGSESQFPVVAYFDEVNISSTNFYVP